MVSKHNFDPRSSYYSCSASIWYQSLTSIRDQVISICFKFQSVFFFFCVRSVVGSLSIVKLYIGTSRFNTCFDVTSTPTTTLSPGSAISAPVVSTPQETLLKPSKVHIKELHTNTFEIYLKPHQQQQRAINPLRSSHSSKSKTPKKTNRTKPDHTFDIFLVIRFGCWLVRKKRSLIPTIWKVKSGVGQKEKKLQKFEREFHCLFFEIHPFMHFL